VGLFLCAHNEDVIELATFDNVRIVVPAAADFRPYRDYIGSQLEVMDVQSGHRRIVHTVDDSLQAPNWTRDGESLIYNRNGLLYRYDLASGEVTTIESDFATENNNDHVISFDGTRLGISHHTGEARKSVIYTMPITGGTPQAVTTLDAHSYLHGWSPDGKHLIYTAQRNGDFDIYRIPSEGGEEINLTNTPGLDDGAEYSPAGTEIYFNSSRSGRMQIWSMDADGKDPRQITDDDYNNWFPHLSPDGNSMVILSFGPAVAADDHPFYKQVYIRLLERTESGWSEPNVVAYVYGGQGTINVPSWSPDGKRIAFVSNSDVVSLRQP
jgi:Tol biopolymer transport system component